MKKLIVILTLVSMAVSASASSNKGEFYIGKWNVEIKGTPGGDSKLVVELKKDGEKFKGTVQSEGDGTVDIKEATMTEEGMQISFKHGWFTVDLLMVREDDDHCNCKLAGHYNGESDRVIAKTK